MILPLAYAAQAAPSFAVETLTEATLLGGTASQATALAKTPAFNEWTVVGESWSVADKPPAGYVPKGDLQAIWDANPTPTLRPADLPGSLGTLPPTPRPFPPLPLSGLDPDLGLQVRFMRAYRVIWCPSYSDALALVAAAFGTRRSPSVSLGRWDAAGQVEGWGTPTYSTTWPKP